MAIKTVRIGSSENAVQYDDADFTGGIETDDVIKAANPVAAEDVVILGGLGSATPVSVANIANPTAELTLDEKRYNEARREFEDLGTDIWCTIDRLTLVKLNSSYTECVDLNVFSVPDNT